MQHDSQKALISENIEQDVYSWAGNSRPKNPLEWTGEFKTAWGKGNKFRFSGQPDRSMGTVFDHSTGAKQTFILKGAKTHFKSTPKPEVKNITFEFSQIKTGLMTNAYLQKKKITPEGLNIKAQSGDLIIPIYHNLGICSWQRINHKGDKKFKKGCPLPPGHHFNMGSGEKYSNIYVCEGFATGVSIHRITGRRVYCAFSKHNLDNVVQNCLKKYRKKTIILCLDNDGPDTHKTTIKDKKLKVVVPTKPGDFNDHQADPKEQSKLRMEPPPLIFSLENEPIRATEYLDEKSLLLKRCLTVLTGPKGCLKSKGMLSYLLSMKIKIGYYSFCETTRSQARAIARALDKEDLIEWIDFEAKDAFKLLPPQIKKHKLDLVWEDPCYEDDQFSTFTGTRKALGTRAKLAEYLGIAWLVSRNFSKTNYSDIINRVGGFGVWTALPRACIGVHPIEEGHHQREGKDKVSLLQTIAVNEGPLPTNSLLLKVKEKQITSTDNKKIDAAYCETQFIDRQKNPELWVQAPKDTSDQDLTREKTALAITEKEPLKSGSWIKTMTKELSISWRTAGRLLSKLKEDGHIEGGGQKGSQSPPLKLTKKGLKYLNE